jgi:hypothetical protein
MVVVESENDVMVMEAPFGEGQVHLVGESPDPESGCDCLCKCKSPATQASSGGMLAVTLSGAFPA